MATARDSLRAEEPPTSEEYVVILPLCFFARLLTLYLRFFPVATQTEAANAQHYEVPTPFFQSFLGPFMKYSSCEWAGEEESDSLANAEGRTLQAYCKHARLEVSKKKLVVLRLLLDVAL